MSIAQPLVPNLGLDQSRSRLATVDLIEQFSVFCFIALSPIQDLSLQAATPLKALAACASLIPLLPMIALAFARWIAGGLKCKPIVLWCCAYAGLLTMYGFFRFGVVSEGENLFVKTLTHLITLGIFLLAVFVPDYELRGTVRAACYTAFVILVLGIFFSQSAPFGLPQVLEGTFLHYDLMNDAARPRGLSTEPSTLSITVICIGLLSAHFSRKQRNKALLVLATVGLLIASASKGGILILILCPCILVFVTWRRWYQIPLLAMALFVIGLTASFWVPALFPEQGVEASESVQTRSSMMLCAVYSVEHHPFGVGFSGFIPAIREYLPQAMAAIQGTTGLPLEFAEGQGYLSSAEGISSKTFFFDQLIRFGLPFVVFFVVLTLKLLKRLARTRQQILFTAILASSIALSTYVPFNMQFATAILFGVAVRGAGRTKALEG